MFFVLLFLVIDSRTTSALTAFACEGETLKLKCRDSQLISIENANYGRTQPGDDQCPKQGRDWNLVCYSQTAKDYVTKRCMFENECILPALSILFGDPCKNIHKYLEVNYKCLKFKYTCSNENLKIKCLKGLKINVIAVHYGSIIPTYLNCTIKRINRKLAYTPYYSCTGSNLPIFFQNRCNGQGTCSIPPRSYQFWDQCYINRKYLIVVYSCENTQHVVSTHF